MTDNDYKKEDKKNNTLLNESEQVFDPTRRRFIKNTGLVIGGVAGGSLFGGFISGKFNTDNEIASKNKEIQDSHPMEARMFFSRFEDFAVLEQATERIYPEDDNGPGAIKLGVPYFIDKQLASSWGMNGKNYRKGPFPNSNAESDQSRLTRGDIFLSGIRKMNELSKKKFKVVFHEANEEQQIEILEEFDNDNVDMKGVSSASFFQLLRTSVLEGAYSDPLYGGNRNMAGWKMKEFPGPVISYADIIEKDEFVKMEPISLTDYQKKS